MIGIDTNILLRFFEPYDDPAQTTAVRRLIAEQSPVFINPVVMVELVWALRTSFGLDRPAICSLLNRLVSSPEFSFAFQGAVERAVLLYGQGTSDFADCLIGELNLDLGCDATMTFDKKASKTVPFQLLRV